VDCCQYGTFTLLCVSDDIIYALCMRDSEKVSRTVSTAWKRLPDGGIAELVFNAKRHTTSFSVYRKGLVVEQDAIELDDGSKLVPISAENNLIKHRAILLPEVAEPYESVRELLALIGGYLYKYVDLSHSFRKIAACYVLLTWVYDAFNELPYLRLRGDFGSGKTRALTVIGSICYRPFFASGASTVSPIFHTLDSFGGTMVFDEADFRFSDEKSELVKIFNNGNVRGFPVLRTAITLKKEFDPRAFNVYGPKIIAMRKSFQDEALESRFLTEEMGQRRLRTDIPINLPNEQQDEALALRNKLLMYRFETFDTVKLDDRLADPAFSPRLNQILVPLLSLVDDEKLRKEICDTAGSLEQYLYRERSTSIEAGVLEILVNYFSEEGRSHVTIAEVTTAFTEKFGSDYERPITNRFMGNVIRKRLHLAVYKSHGYHVIPIAEAPKVSAMAIRFGVIELGDSVGLLE
jgi:hypothetical protein